MSKPKKQATTGQLIQGEQILLRAGTLAAVEVTNGLVGFPISAVAAAAALIGVELSVRFVGMVWGHSIARARLRVAEQHGEEMLRRKRAANNG